MRYINSVLGIGIFLIVLPALGFPSAWKSFFLLALGLWLLAMSFSMRSVRATSVKHKRTSKKIHVVATAPEPVVEIKQPEVFVSNSNEQSPTV
ncbi:MAG: hypothetical protein V4467_01750 [Patescibacteria group bacterium]